MALYTTYQQNPGYQGNMLSNQHLMNPSLQPMDKLRLARKSPSATSALIYCNDALEEAMIMALNMVNQDLPDKEKAGDHHYFTLLIYKLAQENLIDIFIQSRIMEIQSLCDVAKNHDIYNRWASMDYKEELDNAFSDKDTIINETESIVNTLIN